ncbi:MAG: Histidine kinase, partial [Ramlibacter sp.]|nr:Histidine kinase [Ramlibacter sp.]
ATTKIRSSRATAFLNGGGDTGGLIAERDWSTTLGPLDAWPQCLKTATSILLRSPVPLVMLWGEDGIMIYNDAYSVFAGARHPDLLGSKVREGWPEVAAFNDNVMRVCLAGKTLHYKDQELTLYRHGRAEQVWMDLDYSPVLDESGQPAGVLAVVIETTQRVAAERATRQSEARLRAYVTATSDVLYRMSPDWTQLYQLDGQGFIRDAEQPTHDWIKTYIVPEDQPRMREAIARAIETKSVFELEHRVRRVDGSLGWTFSRAIPLLAANGEIVEWFGAAADVTERKRREALELAQNRVLELAIQDTPLSEPLDALIRTVEEYSTGGTIGSILIMDVDGRRLRHGSAPSLPEEYNRAIDGIVIGEGVGSCGTAAHRKKPVFVSDIEADPLWSDFRELARAHGLRACWSMPILSGGGEILGTFAMYHREPRTPSPADLSMVDFVLRSASLAIEHKRTNQALRVSSEELRASRDRVQEESRALEILNATGAKVAAELDLGALVQTVVDAGVELTGARFGAFFYNVLNEHGESYMLFALSGADRSQFEAFGMPRSTAVFEPTFKGEGVVRSDDILLDPRYGRNSPHRGMPEGHLPVRSYLALPVTSRSGEVIGGLLFGHPDVGRFDDRAERVMTGLAGQAATGIENARLLEQVKRSNAELERRVVERTAELEEAHEALRQSQKMEAVGQLTGGIAHDFNNMLAVVMGSLDLLVRRIGDGDARAKRYADAAADGARRAAQLTQRLLAFSRQQPLRPEPLDINKLVAGMSDLLRRSLGADIQLETVLAGGLWRTHADPNQLENVILNLAVNARDAMPGGGRLTIESQNAHLDERYCSAHLGVTSGQYVLVAVTDTGSGMPQDVIAKAFDPFFTTKEVGKGTGLGLSQVYGFVKQSAGHVKIYSEVGQGTTVKIYLPRFIGGGPEDADLQDAEDVPLGEQHEVVLVVEDEAAVRQFSADAVRELGYRVLEADGGVAALRLLDAHPEIAVLFTDVVMPEVNGAKLADEVRRRRPDIKVLFTTGYTRNAVVHNGVLDPGVQMIGKPFTIDELASNLREVLDTPTNDERPGRGKTIAD